MRANEISGWCVKHIALLFITIIMMLMKGCAGCVETERMGLLQLKSYLLNHRNDTEESFLDSWTHNDSKSDCCHWERVKCSDTIGGHIVNLTLRNTIPYLDVPLNLSLLHSFPQLETLDLSWNRFTDLFDPIHGYKSFQRLEKLRTLDFYGNRLNNSVLPFLSAATSLRTLNLGQNQLEGFFSPNGVVFPSSLQVLNLKCNQLSLTHEGYSEICRLTYLRELDLSFNALTNLPYCLGNLSHLQTLNLGFNQLAGLVSLNGVVFPSWLQVLNLEVNQLSLTHEGYSDICRLRYLRELDLSFNALTNLPYCLGNLTHLRSLDLGGNQLEGVFSPNGVVFPSSLQVLELQYNQLSLTLEGYSEICRLRYLKELDLSFNALTNLPYCLGNLSHLRTLDLSYNELNGDLSSFVAYLPSALEYLSLLQNNFNGSFFFKSLVNQTRLTVFRLSSKVGMIQAQYESSWVPLFQLKILQLQNFNFCSTFPGFLVHQHDLVAIDISHNKLKGAFPTWLVQNNTRLQILFLNSNLLTKLQLPRLVHGLRELDISSNRIYDSIQEDIGLVFPKLRYMNFSSNHLHGTIPSSMGYMKSLENLDISYNSFSGSIPRDLNFSFLIELSLQNNEFTGSIPDTLFKSPSLVVLDLRNNNLSGKIPDTIGKASRLSALLLRNNSLQSHTLEKICQLSKVSVLDLSHNKFKGIIPSCLGNMAFGNDSNDGIFDYRSSRSQITVVQNWSYTTALFLNNYYDTEGFITVDFVTKGRYEAYQGGILGGILRYMYGLDLSSNQLSGEIPIEIGDLENIKSLNLSSNHLTGSIPSSFSKLKDLESLDLSNNKLDGNIPPMLADLHSLGSFNVSCNNLSGEIPFKGHLVTFERMSYIGNAHLCGLPTNKSCYPTGVLEPSASKQAKDEEEDDDVIDMVWFYWTCGAVYISTSLALFVFLCIDSHWSRKWDYGVDLFIYHLQRFKGRFISS